MAKMIPSRIDESVPSSAERRIFGLLESDPATGRWTVLHSLGLARRRTGPYGEIDFVVIIPGEGIVCLEVKGGRVSCENGIWQTVDRNNNVAILGKSPFMQARESMFALRQFVIDHFGRSAPEAQCPVVSAVVFPDVPCPPPTPEFERSEVIDTHDLRKPISNSIGRIASTRLSQFQARSSEHFPTPTHVRSILNFLRPNFDFVVSRALTVRRTEEKILSLTEEQYARLDELEANARCLFEGAAGTGKTVLAVEYARRASASGARVLLVCFNRLLGDLLRQQVDGTGILSGTWHEVLRQLITRSSVGDEFLQQEREALTSEGLTELFGVIYPFYGEIAIEEMDALFDVLVMDEGQDLFTNDNLDLINRILRGGLAGGQWAIFGDFTRQALYDSAGSAGISLLPDYCDFFARARLSLNCRNTQRIAEETSIIGGFETPPFRMGAEPGMPVEHRYWRTPRGLVKSLSNTIDRLVNDGLSADELMILSPKRLENSALAGETQISGLPIVDVSRSLEVDRECIRFSTIHSFKGLESTVVIVIDIDGVEGIHEQSLMYVGMSRAHALLILMIHEQARRSVDGLIRMALEKELQN